MKAWDFATGRELLTVGGVGGPTEFSPDGTVGAVPVNGHLELRNTADGGLKGSVPVRVPGGVCFTDGGKSLLVVDLAAGRIRRANLLKDEPPVEPPVELPGKLPLTAFNGNVLFLPKFSPDGRWLAVGQPFGAVNLWDVLAGKVAHTFQGVPMHVACLAWQPDGKRLVAGYPNGFAVVWDVGAKAEVRRFRPHGGSVDAAVFSPDGRRLATGGQDLAVRVWDAATGLATHTLRGNTSATWGLAFTPDNGRLVTGSWDRSVRVWELTDTRHFAGRPAKNHADALTLLPPAADTHRSYYAAGMPFRLALSPDGRRAAAVSNSGAVNTWDLDAHTPAAQPSVPFGAVGAVAFSPAGDRLAYLHGTRIGGPAGLRVWDPATGKAVVSKEFPREGKDGDSPVLTYTPDGSQVVGCLPGHATSRVRTWDAATGVQAEPLTIDGRYVVALGFAAAGRELAVVTTRDVRVYSWPGRQLLRSREKGVPTAECGAVSAGLVAVGAAGSNGDAGIRLYDLATLQPVRTLEGHVGGVSGVAFSPDGSRLVSAGNELAVKVWHAGTGRELLTFRDHARPVTAVGWSGDGRRVASCSQDGMLKVWTAPADEADPTTGWPVLFADRFDVPHPAWKLGSNWAVENGALRGTQTPVANGREGVFNQAVTTVPVPPLPRTVDVRYTVWSATPRVAGASLHSPRADLTIQPLLGSADNRWGQTGAFTLVMQKSEAGGGRLTGMPRDKVRFEAGRRHRVRVLRDRADLTVWIDGEKVFTVPVPAGEAPELRLEGAWGEAGETVQFDDLEVRAPAAAVAERRLLDRLDGWFDGTLLRAATLERIDAADLPPADKQFLRGQVPTYVEDPQKLADAARPVLERPDATPGEYARAARQAEAAARLASGTISFQLLRGLGEYRTGRFRECVETLRQGDELMRAYDAGPTPWMHAVRALAHHRLGEPADARAFLRRACDGLYSEAWAADAVARGLVAEAEQGIEPPPDPDGDAVRRVVFAAEQRGYKHNDPAGYLAALSDDVRVTGGRTADPDAHDVTHDKQTWAGFVRYAFQSGRQATERLLFDDVRCDVTGDRADFRYTVTMVHAADVYTRWASRADLRRAGDGWAVTALRTWLTGKKAGGKPTTWDAAHYAARDAAAAADTTPRTLLDARRFREALVLARERTAQPKATAADWLARTEAAFETGGFEEMRTAVDKALAVKPDADLPWFLTRLRQTLPAGGCCTGWPSTRPAGGWPPAGTPAASGSGSRRRASPCGPSPATCRG